MIINNNNNNNISIEVHVKRESKSLQWMCQVGLKQKVLDEQSSGLLEEEKS